MDAQNHVPLEDYEIDATDKHVLIHYEDDDGSNGVFSVYLMPFRPKLTKDEFHVRVSYAQLESWAKYRLVQYGLLASTCGTAAGTSQSFSDLSV